MIVGRGTSWQQTLGSELVAPDIEVDPAAMYLVRSQIMMLWPYDDRCRLLGEDVWEYEDVLKACIKLEPDEVLTVQQTREMLDPYIRPLPPFEEGFLPK